MVFKKSNTLKFNGIGFVIMSIIKLYTGNLRFLLARNASSFETRYEKSFKDIRPQVEGINSKIFNRI
jgi:hypothetical protein